MRQAGELLLLDSPITTSVFGKRAKVGIAFRIDHTINAIFSTSWNLVGRRKFALACLHFVPLGHGFGDINVDVTLDPFVVPSDGNVTSWQLFVYMLPPKVKR